MSEAAAQPGYGGIDITSVGFNAPDYAKINGGAIKVVLGSSIGEGNFSTNYGIVRYLIGTVSAVGLASGDSLASVTAGQSIFTTTANHLSGIGNYAVVGSGLSATSANYVTTFVQDSGNARALTLLPRTLTITVNPTTRAYGVANPSFSYSVAAQSFPINGYPTVQVQGNGLVNGDTVTGTLATTATPGSAAGQYLIQPGSVHASPNYTLVFSNAYLTISPPVTQTVTGSIPGPVTPVTPVVGRPVVTPRPIAIPPYTPPPPPAPPLRPTGPCGPTAVSSGVRSGRPTTMCTAG